MKNKTVLSQVIELLQQVNPDELETVQIENTHFDDGSIGFIIELTYPTKDTEEITTYDGNHYVVDIEKR